MSDTAASNGMTWVNYEAELELKKDTPIPFDFFLNASAANDVLAADFDDKIASGFYISKFIPVVNKTMMELDGTGLRFYNENTVPAESFDYLNNMELNPKWVSLGQEQTTSLDFNEIITMKQGGYGSSSIGYSTVNYVTNESGSSNSQINNGGPNYLTYPCKYLSLTQSYYQDHTYYTTNPPYSYPIDQSYSRGFFYCPCDEIKIIDLNWGGTTNYIILQSTSKCTLANGTYDYVCILMYHSENSDLKRFSKGQTFKRKEPINQEGNQGRSTGNHLHIATATGEFKNMTSNTAGSWVINSTGKNIKPEEAYFIDPNFTTIVSTMGLKFKNLPTSS